MVIKGREQNVNISAARTIIPDEKESHTRNVALERQRKKRTEEKKEAKEIKKINDTKEKSQVQTLNPKRGRLKTERKKKIKTATKNVVKNGAKKAGKNLANATEKVMESSADYEGNKISDDGVEYAGRFMKKQQEKMKKIAVRAVVLLAKELIQLVVAIIAAISNMFVLAIICVVLLVVIVSGTVGNLSLYETNTGFGTGFPPAVMQWEAMVDEAIERNNEPDSGIDLSLFKNCILATIQQESGGVSDGPGVNGDIMQCAESGYMNSCPADWPIEKKSIDAGTRYFYACLKKWEVSDPNDTDGLQMVAQGYNYGLGFLDWAKENGYTSWTIEMSKEYSMLKGHGSTSYGTYTYGSTWLQKLYAGGGVVDSDLVADADFIWPLDASHTVISSPFGKRNPPTAGASDWHRGVDLNAGMGDEIYAVIGGKVTYKNYQSGGGNTITVQSEVDGKRLSITYMHNSSFANVNVGDMVSTGQIIAYAGSTGVSTGPHCHLQVIYDGDYMNAMLFLYGGNQGIAALNAEGNLVPINVDGSPNSLGTNWDTYYSRTSDGRWILKNGEEN